LIIISEIKNLRVSDHVILPSSAPDSDGGRMSTARRRRTLFVFRELKVANFALLLSVRQTENRINDYVFTSEGPKHIY